MTDIPWKDSIAARLLIKVFQYYIFITIIVTLAHMMMDFSFTKDFIEDDLKVFHSSFEPGLSVALWNQEDEAIHTSLSAIYQVPQIEGAKIVDENGSFVTAVGIVFNNDEVQTFYDPKTLTIDDVKDVSVSGLFSYSKEIHHVEDGVNYFIGKLILYSSNEIVLSQVQYGYIFIVINSIIKTLALWGIVLWQSKPLIYEPLKRISEKLNARNVKDLSSLTFKIEKSENAEFLMLKSSMNKLFEMLSISFAERDTALTQASRKNEELSQFAYRTSHDLKAPLVTVRGLAEVMIEDLNDADYDEVLLNANKIGGYVYKLENLVTDILNLARADLEISDQEKIDIYSVVDEIKERLGQVYIDNDVDVILDIDNGIDIYASKTRITQILENLISNAIKYCDFEKKSRFVHISTDCNAGVKNLYVKDNGIGIPESSQSNMFGMFQRFHPNLAQGSGLGMYIVKQHIIKMSAQIDFASSNEGTIFSIRFNE